MKRIYLIAFICLILASCDTTSVPSVSTTEQTSSINLSWKGSLSSAPQNPQAGDMYYNTTHKKSCIYDGSSWQIIAQDGKNGSNSSNDNGDQNTVTDIDGYLILWQGSLNAAPSNPAAGWAYYDTTKKKSFIYDGTDWQVLAQDGNDGHDGQDGQSGTSNTNSNTSIKDTVYIGESTETIEGITYTVQSYADVYAANPYFYTYYKNYYLNDKLRRIYCFYHNIGSALDYPYTEFQEHYCNNLTSYPVIYTYYENGHIESNTNYSNGHISTSYIYYESGNKKTMNYYQQGNLYYTYTYYDNEYNTNKTYEIFLETNPQKTTYYENGKTEYQIVYDADGTELIKNYYTYYENGEEKLHIKWSFEILYEYSFNYESGYRQYYYCNGYLYTYDDEKTKTNQTSSSYYSTKTAFTEEEALAKLEELRNE
jgi:hypothetical protein